MEFKKTENLNYLEFKKNFTIEDKKIFPLSFNPKFYKCIDSLYIILSNEIEIGFLYVMKNSTITADKLPNEVGIYIYTEYRNCGFGKKAIYDFLNTNKDHYVVISKKNRPMRSIVLNNVNYRTLYTIREDLIGFIV